MINQYELFLSDWQIEDIINLLFKFDYHLADVLRELRINIDIDRAVDQLGKRGWYIRDTGQFFLSIGHKSRRGNNLA